MSISADNAVECEPISASGLVKKGPGALYGVVVVASSSGNIALYDAESATGTALVSKAVSAGEVIHFGGVAMRLKTALYFQLVSGTATVRPLYR